ncbi:OmpA family protein [Alcanivorax hongdengensis]|nr:OmpA family protein [Alcanivorax hongdengensis]
MKKSNAVMLTATSLFVLQAGCVAPSPEEAWPGYRTDGSGQLLKTADGHCWRTTGWTENKAVPECDVAITGEPVAEVENSEPVRNEVIEIAAPEVLRVTFAFDAADLTKESRIALKAWYQDVARLERPVVEIDGYSDPLGGYAYNQKLARRRAQAVASWWKQQSGDIATLQVEGHGEDSAVSGYRCQSVSVENLKSCYQQDRRVELRIQGK